MRFASAADVVARAWSDGIRPPPQLSIVQWCEANLELDSRLSRIPGPYRLVNSPYAAEILETLSDDSPVEKVAVMKGGQIGLTLMAHAWVGYSIVNDPSNFLLVMPTVDDAKDTSKTKIAPLIECSPSLRERVKPARERDSGNTLLLKEYPGGSLMLAGANSSSKLSSRSGRRLLLDEVDRFPYALKNEGDPVQLSERFTTTFPRRKHLYISTPTTTGHSRIAKLFAEGDRSRFFVPCPHCGELQVLVFRDKNSGKFHIQWEGIFPDIVAFYVCVKCERRIEESHKGSILDAGQWRAERPELSESFRSFHLSSLYSPPGTFSWTKIVHEYLAIKVEGENFDLERYRVFTNLRMGEPWEEKGDAPPWEIVFGRRETWPRGTVPAGGLVLTAGVDVQRSRIELEVVAWGPRLESWSIDYETIPGDPADDEVWKKLDIALQRTYRHATGSDLRIRVMAIDSGDGDTTSRVYGYVRGKTLGHVIATKGMESLPVLLGGSPKLVDVTASGRKLRRGVQLWMVGTSIIKRELYSELRLEPPKDGKGPFPPGYCHFPSFAGYDQDHFRQLTAEQLVARKNERGYMTYHWERKQERNEALDCRVYARAAAAILGIDRWTEGDWARAAAGMSPAQSSANVARNAGRETRYGSLGLDRWRSRRHS